MSMSARNHRSRGKPALVVGVVCVLLAVALLPPVVQAAQSGLPSQPTAEPLLPPRPTPQPTPQPKPVRPPAGGFIELCVQFPQTWPWADVQWQELWTIVQWQDRWGDWHEVEGWQGTLDEVNRDEGAGVWEGKKVWWVAKADLGTGPFRWVVYRARGSKPVAQSESFYLPDSSGERVRVEVSLGP